MERLLEDLKAKGLSQRDVADRVGVPTQYLSDVKRGTRTLTELFARRLQAEFAADYRWLLGETDAMRPPSVGSPPHERGAGRRPLPVLSVPIAGEPHASAIWDGTTLEIVGAMEAKVAHLMKPYVLRIADDDRHGRLRRNDLLLISQADDDLSTWKVIKSDGRLLLARLVSARKWEPLGSENSVIKQATVVGCAVGIVWGAL